MKSLQELNAIRERMQKQTLNRDAATENSTRVVVGMATCGIAAGAKPVMSAFLEEVSKRNLKHVVVSQTGCIGMCKLEPIVEVFVPTGKGDLRQGHARKGVENSRRAYCQQSACKRIYSR